MQKRNFSWLPSSDAVQDNGVGAVLGDCVVDEMDAIVGSILDVLRDVGIIVLRSHHPGISRGSNERLGVNLLTSKTRSAPRFLTSSWLRLEAVVTTL